MHCEITLAYGRVDNTIKASLGLGLKLGFPPEGQSHLELQWQFELLEKRKEKKRFDVLHNIKIMAQVNNSF